MLTPAIVSLLVGMVLGHRFKVLILVPAIFLAILFAVGSGVARAETAWTVVATAAIAACGLQIGYLFGTGIRRIMVLARASRLRGVPFAGPLQTRRQAH